LSFEKNEMTRGLVGTKVKLSCLWVIGGEQLRNDLKTRGKLRKRGDKIQ